MSYIFSRPTISIDLHKFESGEANKLLIIGLAGSGKTTLGEILAEKCNVPLDNTDQFTIKYKYKNNISDEKFKAERTREQLNLVFNNQRSIVEGIAIPKKIPPEKIKDFPMIILGASLLRSSWQASHRTDIPAGKKKSFFFYLLKNIKEIYKNVKLIRRERIKIPGSIVKEFKIK